MGFLIVFRRWRHRGGAPPRRQSRLGPAVRHTFPWHTAIENVTGSLAMGLLAGYFAFRADPTSQTWRLFLTTGILGGYTTFSSFSLDFALLYERGEMLQAALYVLGSVVLGILGLFAGLALVRHFT